MLKIPFVGSGVLGSAISMDKIISKLILESRGLPVSKYLYYSVLDREQISFQFISDKLGIPFMVKSSNQGSSVGVSKVTDIQTFNQAIDEGFKYSDEILLESFIKGMEVECAIYGNATPESTWPGEIHLKKEYDFYTYEAKYQDPDAIDMVIPAPLSLEVQKQIRKLSEQAYLALKCNDFARIDIFVTPEEDIFINEINTIPGFTNASMFPSMWKNMGVSYPELISRLINFAFERWEKEKRLQTHYEKA
jgi:D-alanine-D-alanine ligase